MEDRHCINCTYYLYIVFFERGRANPRFVVTFVTVRMDGTRKEPLDLGGSCYLERVYLVTYGLTRLPYRHTGSICCRNKI